MNKKNLIKFLLFLGTIIILAIFAFRFIDQADKRRNEAAALGTIENISKIQRNFNCASLSDLLEKQMIDPKLNDGIKAGYIFKIIKSEKRCEITAFPENSSKGNRLFYATNEDNWQIHFSESSDKTPDKNSPILMSEKSY